VEEVGSGVAEEWQGKSVGIFPLIPCKKCPSCLKQQYEMCEQYNYIGSRRDGAFAEYVRVPEWNLIPLPGGVSYQAAAIAEPMAVAVHAIRRATGEFSLSKDSRIAVCGLGTIGLLMLAFLQDAGYENLYGIGNKPSQLARAKTLGLREEQLYVYRKNEGAGGLLSFEHAARQGNDFDESSIQSYDSQAVKNIDLYFECVGKNETVSLGLEMVSAAGRIMLVGNPFSDMTLDRGLYWKILRKQITLLGTWNSSFTKKENDDWHYVMERLARGGIQPERLITHHLLLDQLEEGLLLMRDKSEDYCKVMVEATDQNE
jgi:L-iditol 2-dehydrogenase